MGRHPRWKLGMSEIDSLQFHRLQEVDPGLHTYLHELQYMASQKRNSRFRPTELDNTAGRDSGNFRNKTAVRDQIAEKIG
jgi:hypothetical protein